ncbi:MAG: hypothetical protein DDT35_01535 [Firmicutes bacterium]|nr:hypothetical protein [Bacillota bacterium]
MRLQKDGRGFSQMLTVAALIPVILLLLGAMVNVSTSTTMQTWVSEAALQGARVGTRSSSPEAAAIAAVVRFGEGVAGWQLGDRLTVLASLDNRREVLTVEVAYTFILLGGQAHTARASSSFWLVDLP